MPNMWNSPATISSSWTVTKFFPIPTFTRAEPDRSAEIWIRHRLGTQNFPKIRQKSKKDLLAELKEAHAKDFLF